MNKTIPTTLGILIIVLVTGVAGVGVLFLNQEDEIIIDSFPLFKEGEIVEIVEENDQIVENTVNEIFIATTENYDDVLDILIFNPTKSEIVFSKKILLEAPLAPAKSHSFGSNDSVQYNPKTKEIFFSTQGYSGYAGSPCQNKDGTCISRFYKTSLEQIKPTILFESNTPPSQWIVNSFDNSLLLLVGEDDYKGYLKKISGEDGKVIFKKEHQTKENSKLNDFVLSKDGKYTFQTIHEDPGNIFHEGILKLRKINNSNGDILEQEIFKGKAIECSNTDISPDGNYLAFYADHSIHGYEPKANLYIYEISTEKLINIPYRNKIRGVGFLWSGDSKKLLYFPENELVYYDISTSENIFISGEPRLAYAMYIWAPSTNYLVYKSQNSEVKIFDMKKNQIINTGATDKIHMRGINWY